MDFQAISVTDKETQLINVCVTLHTDDGEEIIKTISLYEFANMLGSSLLPVIKKEFTHLGKLPIGYIDCFYENGGTFSILVERKAQIRKLFYEQEVYAIPFPRLLFKFVVKDGVLIDKRCAALKNDADLYDFYETYQYPFGNVSSLGSICFGNINLPKINTMTDIDTVIDLFFEGETNDDYYTNGKCIVPHYSQKQLIMLLSKKEVFPEEWLYQNNIDIAIKQN